MDTYYVTIRDHIYEIATRAFTTSWFKLPAAFAGAFASYMFGPENHPAMAALMVLIGLDFATALMAKYKIGEPIESRKALKSAVKVVVYGLFVAASHLTENILAGTTFLDRVAISFLAVTELISITENIGKMGYYVPQKLLNRLYELRDK